MSDPFLERYLPGSSPALKELRSQIALINLQRNQAIVNTLLITGETGSGKNHMARVIAGHRNHKQREGDSSDLGLDAGLQHYTHKFREAPLPSLSSSVFESELFGHTAGAFTDAKAAKVGILAQKLDDILLDEIGDLAEPLQVKLLGVLQSRRFSAVGSTDEQELRARLMFCTHRNLVEHVRTGRFREDLYWRIAGFSLRVPPLREQPENIRPLIKRIVQDVQSAIPDALREPVNLTTQEAKWAEQYSWPGNIRQLQQAIRLRLVFGDSRMLQDCVDEQQAFAPSTTGEHLVRECVSQYLHDREALGEPAAGSLSQFINVYRNQIHRGIVDWYSSRERSGAELANLFPKVASSSIRSQISRWKKGEDDIGI